MYITHRMRVLWYIHTPTKAEYHIPYITNEISNHQGKRLLNRTFRWFQEKLLGNFQLKIHFEMNIFIECNTFIHLYRENYTGLKIMPKCTENFMKVKYTTL